MIARTPNRFRQGLSLICVAAFIAGGSLAVRAGTGRAGGGGNQEGPDTATRPTDEEPATSAPAEKEGARTWAREQLVSGLLGSKHDFSHGGKSGRDLCLSCHTPHLVSTPPPLLDRRAATTQPLRPYGGLEIELTGWSLLCLGCHDGVTAPDVYSVAHATTVTDPMADWRLSAPGPRSHPVGIRYPARAEGLEPIAAVEAAGLLLPNGRIQCTTCHDAHNTHRYRRLLRMSNERSRLCLTCHRI